MSKKTMELKFYSCLEDMRHSEHWHYQRLDESHWELHLTNQEWTILHDEFTSCGMTHYRLTDSFGVSWREFMIDYTEWLKSGNAY